MKFSASRTFRSFSSHRRKVRTAARVREWLTLQARADFGSPINYLSSLQFGQSTQMLGASLVSTWRVTADVSVRIQQP
jgi:hypothetical protein